MCTGERKTDQRQRTKISQPCRTYVINQSIIKRKITMENKEYLTIKEACEYTLRSDETIRRWMKQQPPIRKLWDYKQRCWTLNREDLDAKMETLKKE